MSRSIRQQGFTLIEMLLSIAIIATLGGLSMPVYATFLARNDLHTNSEAIGAALRRAQVYARAGNEDSVWSIKVQPTAVILYKGATFSPRDTSYDETTSLPDTLVASGMTDVTFAKLTALPTTTGTVTLTANDGSTRAITINAKGTVSY